MVCGFRVAVSFLGLAYLLVGCVLSFLGLFHALGFGVLIVLTKGDLCRSNFIFSCPRLLLLVVLFLLYLGLLFSCGGVLPFVGRVVVPAFLSLSPCLFLKMESS